VLEGVTWSYPVDGEFKIDGAKARRPSSWRLVQIKYVGTAQA
jgi:hypothetical protein